MRIYIDKRIKNKKKYIEDALRAYELRRQELFEKKKDMKKMMCAIGFFGWNQDIHGISGPFIMAVWNEDCPDEMYIIPYRGNQYLKEDIRRVREQ